MAQHSDILYIECSVPLGLTLAEYRRSRPPRPSLWQRLRRRPAAASAPMLGQVGVLEEDDMVVGS
jgi:hypothetical protein